MKTGNEKEKYSKLIYLQPKAETLNVFNDVNKYMKKKIYMYPEIESIYIKLVIQGRLSQKVSMYVCLCVCVSVVLYHS